MKIAVLSPYSKFLHIEGELKLEQKVVYYLIDLK